MAFRICTIGCGSMASAGHGPSYARYAVTHPDTRLVACCDLDPDKAGAFQVRFGFARSYTDMRTMLDTEKPDAVCLVAPVEWTCALSCRILEQGYPLLLEKPPGRDVAEIDRMIATADASGSPTQVAFNRRHTPLLTRLKRLLDEKLEPSQIQHIRCDFTRVQRPDADFSTTAIHGIDAVRFLAGSDYRNVRFHYQDLPAFGPTVANFFLHAEMDSGATASLNFLPMTGEVIERITLYTEDQTFALHLPLSNSLDLPGRLQHIERNVRKLDVLCEITSRGGEMFEANGFYDENAAFFDAVRKGVRPVGDLRNARQSVEIAQYLRERRSEYP